MSSVCHSYVLVCHPYVTRMYSYVFRMSLVCTRMSSVCHSYTHSYVLVCHPCVTRMWFYHEPWSFNATLNVHNLSLIFILTFCQYQHKEEIQSLRKLIFYKYGTHWSGKCNSEVYSEFCQTSKTERFANFANAPS